MSTIRTTIIDGHVHVAAPSNLPDGTEVEVHILPLTSDADVGEVDWDDSPNGIEEWIKWYDAIEPLDLTQSERTAIEAAQNDQKHWEKSSFLERSEELRKLWE